jgi:hypothetical protein
MIYLIFDTFKGIGYSEIIQDNLILHYFEKAGLDLNNCFINYVNPTPAGKDVQKEEMDKHIKDIFLDIKEKKPELILCFGKQAKVSPPKTKPP